jgi:hypothetical protein
MLGSISERKGALLEDPDTSTWKILNFTGKADSNSEEGWTLLPDGTVLTIDVAGQSSTGMHSETYNYLTDTWHSAGSTVVRLWSGKALCGTGDGGEIGPAILRPEGTVIAFGANFCGSGNTAEYAPALKLWAAGLAVPAGITGTLNDVADGPASILPDGNILVATSPGWGRPPTTFWEFGFSDDSWISIPQPAFTKPGSTEGGRMLVLGSGNVMYSQTGTDELWIYSKDTQYPDAWRPTICNGCYPTTVQKGKTYSISGTQFNGLSGGAAYGDDYQSATNFPLVMVTNNSTGDKHYARTHDFRPNGVQTGNILTISMFDVTPNIETGMSTLVVIANGIPSLPVTINVTK